MIAQKMYVRKLIESFTFSLRVSLVVTIIWGYFSFISCLNSFRAPERPASWAVPFSVGRIIPLLPFISEDQPYIWIPFNGKTFSTLISTGKYTSSNSPWPFITSPSFTPQLLASHSDIISPPSLTVVPWGSISVYSTKVSKSSLDRIKKPVIDILKPIMLL